MNKTKSPCNRKCKNRNNCIKEKGEKEFNKEAKLKIYCDMYEKEEKNREKQDSSNNLIRACNGIDGATEIK